MKTMHYVLKSAAALCVVAYSYINHNWGPLFWVLAALVAIDLILNVRHGGLQFEKLGAAFSTLGVPALIASHVGQPDFAKIAVTVLTLVYLQVVFPQLTALVGKLPSLTHGVVTPSEVAALQQELAAAKQQLTQYASQVAPTAAPVAAQVTQAMTQDAASLAQVTTGGQAE